MLRYDDLNTNVCMKFVIKNMDGLTNANVYQHYWK